MPQDFKALTSLSNVLQDIFDLEEDRDKFYILIAALAVQAGGKLILDKKYLNSRQRFEVREDGSAQTLIITAKDAPECEKLDIYHQRR